MQRKIWISEVCLALKLIYEGRDVELDGLNLCNRPSEHSHILSYVTSGDYVENVKNNDKIVCLVVDSKDVEAYSFANVGHSVSMIVCKDPEKIFYDIHDYLYYKTDFYDKFEFESVIGKNCDIHPSAVIDRGVVIGDNVAIGANSVIKKGSIIKNFCTIGCNSTIGSEGFQVLRVGGVNRKIIHCGGVLLNEYASIGDNTAVCNALFEGKTYVGVNAMVDNLVYVGHNGYVGDGAVVTAGTVLCGSSRVENDAWIGVNSSVLNRVSVGKNAKIGMESAVTRDVPENSLAYGVPAKVKIVFGGAETGS